MTTEISNDLQIPWWDGKNHQEKLFWYNKLVESIPEIKNLPVATFDPEFTYYRLVNDGRIKDPTSPTGLDEFIGSLISTELSKTREELDKLYARKNENIINVKDLGAVGDGVTDDFNSVSLALAIADMSGGTVYFPKGKYFTEYRSPSDENNYLVITRDGTKFKGDSATLKNFLIYVKGTYGEPLSILSDISPGSKEIKTVSNHSLKSRDFVQMLSCINAYSTDGGEWQLGSKSPTDGNLPVARYTEIVKVGATPDTATIVVEGEIIYPTYPANSSGLSFPIAGVNNSQVRKLNVVKDVMFRGITFEGRNNNGRGIIIRAAAHLRFVDCGFDSGELPGALVKMTDSIDVKFIRCRSDKNLDAFSGSSWNTLFIGGGCQEVFFNHCNFTGEAQNIDFTPNLFNSSADLGGSFDAANSMSTTQLIGVYSSTFNGCSDALTSHPATFMFEVANNLINGGSVGVRARSRSSVIRDNTIHTSRGGVALSSFLTDSIVVGNTLIQRVSAKYSGYYTGVAYNATSSEIESDNSVRNLIVKENDIKVTTTNAMNAGIWLSHYDPPLFPVSNSVKVRRSDIVIENNTLRKCSVVVDKWVNGAFISKNSFKGGSDRAFYVMTLQDSAANEIIDNIFQDNLVGGVQTGEVTLTGHSYSTKHRVSGQKCLAGVVNSSLLNTDVSYGQSGTVWDNLEVLSGGKLTSARAAGAATFNIDAIAKDGTSAVTVNVFKGNSTTGLKLFDIDGRAQADEYQLPTGQLIKAGAGTPEGIVYGITGSIYLRTDGIAGATLYVKEGTAGITGWSAK